MQAAMTGATPGVAVDNIIVERKMSPSISSPTVGCWCAAGYSP
jgi:hypothetical protein